MIPARRLSPAILRRLFFNARAACTTLAAICCQAAVCASPLSALLVGLGLVLSSAANAQTAHFMMPRRLSVGDCQILFKWS